MNSELTMVPPSPAPADNEAPTVFFVDDDASVRKSVRFLVESIGIRIETFESAREFLDAFDPSRPGCLVLDIRMPGMSGLDLQDHLREQGHLIPTIILTGYGEVDLAVRAMKAGAVDFLEKPISDQTLIDHINRSLEIDAGNRRSEETRCKVQSGYKRLTKREKEVMWYVVDGMSSKEIGADLNVSFKTIEAHRGKIMSKMEAHNVPHLIRMTMDLPRRPADWT